jgi:hypothetical protein
MQLFPPWHCWRPAFTMVTCLVGRQRFNASTGIWKTACNRYTPGHADLLPGPVTITCLDCLTSGVRFDDLE